ncbi:hypothetical protein LCGC14_0932500 [marine sediment metagenome]|uniref:HK97 gp10 family phage protein n=1 Tax=marine sediment metagenome TaxID=412755 RepID=A0A0F9NMK4_9ZZZZ
MSPVNFEVVVEGDALDFSPVANRAIDKAFELMATEVWGNIAREAPTDEGRLGGSFELVREGSRQWRVFTNALYATFVHDGTGIHGPVGRRIVPKRASVLVYRWMGKTWFSKSVAGQKPNPFADRAIAQAETRAEDFAKLAIRQVFDS